MLKFLSLLLIFGLSFGLFEEVQCKVINCYWGTWAYYRNSKGRFDASNIDPNLCTHLSYSFFGITEAGSFRFLDSWLDINLNNLNRAVALKQTNRNLKLLASIGGWNEGSTKYSQMAGDPVKRRTFVESTVAFMDEYGFDGISLDWEYPNQRGGVPADKQNLIQLLKELKEAFRPKGRELFIAVAAAEASASLSYDIPEICKYVDFINIMTYDFNGSWDPVIGINAPLQGFGQNNVAASIDYWLRSGATAQKILLGIASYGRTFRLANTAATNPGSPSAGAGNPGLYTQEAGFWSYYEICEQFSQNVWEVRWDQVAYAPYAFRGNQWVGYENVESINAKIDYMKSLDLGGAFLWSIESDDFNNVCGDGRYPLLTAVNNRMYDESMTSTTTVTTSSPTTETTCLPTSTTTARPTTTTARPPTTTTGPTTTSARTTTTTALPTTTTVRPTTTTRRTTTTTQTPSPPNVELCTVDGWYRHESDCTRFYRCIAGKRYDFQCRPGLVYDNSIRSCNFPSLVNCNT